MVSAAQPVTTRRGRNIKVPDKYKYRKSFEYRPRTALSQNVIVKFTMGGSTAFNLVELF
jgi:hypothetical protein